MAMLTLDYLAEDLLHRYTGFISTLTWYRMYCAGRMGQKKADYLDGFQSLYEAYEHLWDIDEEMPPEWQLRSIADLLDSIRAILNSKRLTNEQILNIGSLIREFQSKHEATFQKNYVKAQVEQERRSHYFSGLPTAVVDLLENDNTDEAIITAFKFLDNHLQNLLRLAPYQYYGEDLINHAFSPKTGVLQLGTDPNEQIGLRNFFSGANAIFRNPTAHRFVKHDLFFAASIVTMVNAMSKMATQIAEKNV